MEKTIQGSFGAASAFQMTEDMEPQKNYRPGYPIEKRGIYYLSRRLCSQLDVVTEKTKF